MDWRTQKHSYCLAAIGTFGGKSLGNTNLKENYGEEVSSEKEEESCGAEETLADCCEV